MRRGDIWWADLDPIRGAESDKLRPVLIVSNDGANSKASALGHGVVTIIPLTSNTAKVYPFQVLIGVAESGLSRDSKAQAEQVRSIDVTRLQQYAGRVGRATMSKISDALRLHLPL